MIALTWLTAAAFAWEHLGHVVELPLTWRVDGGCPEGLPDCEQAVEAAFAAWAGTVGGCVALSAEQADDAVLTFAFTAAPEPTDDASLHGVTTYEYAAAPVSLNGTDYRVATRIVTHLDPDLLWIDECSGADADPVIVHTVGHAFGLGHSCDEFEDCPWSLSDAAMDWRIEPCEPGVPLADDREGMAALYGGPAAEVTCTPAVGTAPLTVRCAVGGHDLVTDATWLFGDGGVDEGVAVAHTFEEPGNYAPRAAYRGLSDQCDDGTYAGETSAVVPIRVCPRPEPVFTAERLDPGVWQVVNETQPIEQACVTNIWWSVHRGEGVTGEVVFEGAGWAPKLTLPDDGPYTIVMNLAGVDETAAASLVVRGPALGCGGSRAALGLPLLLLARRRRGATGSG